MTPFSGLSFIIHLIVIAVATAFGSLFGKKGGVVKKEQADISLITSVSKQALSILIIIVVSSFMFLSFFTALKTGVREGMDEPHIVYIREELGNVGLQNVAAESESISIGN